MAEKLDLSKNAGLLRRLFGDGFRKQAPLYGIAVVSMIVVAVMTALAAWIMRDIVNETIIGKSVDRVFAIAIAVAAIFIAKGVATYVQGYFLSKAGNRIIAEQQRKLFDHYLAQDIRFFQASSSSDLLIRITHNAQSARAVIDVIVTAFVRDLLTLLGLFAVMVIQQPVLSIAALALAPIALFGVRALLGRARRYMARELTAITQIMQTVKEATDGIRVVKAFSLEPLLKARMDVAVRDVEKHANRITRLEAATGPIMETLAGFAIAGMLALSAVLVLKYGHTPGELMSFITALLLAYDPAKRLARMRVSIETGLVGVKSMFDVLDQPIMLSERSDAVALKPGPGAVDFHGVDFSFTDGKAVLAGIDVRFEPGKTTALVGPSGAGKSTVVNLVMRLYDPDKGTVSIDGQDLKATTFDSLRRKIAYVGQEAFLFSGTVRYNIALGDQGATEEEIVAAAKAANAHEFILNLPQGYDSVLTEGGANLSGGQRQRLTIARAILRNAEILILDEPTSALDAESEALIQTAMDRLTRNRTTIVIAHRLSTIARADRIIVMNQGRVVESGTQKDLLAADGLYKRLFEMQLNAGNTESRTPGEMAAIDE